MPKLVAKGYSAHLRPHPRVDPQPLGNPKASYSSRVSDATCEVSGVHEEAQEAHGTVPATVSRTLENHNPCGFSPFFGAPGRRVQLSVFKCRIRLRLRFGYVRNNVFVAISCSPSLQAPKALQEAVGTSESNVEA